MRKVKGSTLIEVIVGISILVTVITMSAKVFVGIKNGFEVRSIEEEIARDMYCVVQELKYNYNLEEIKQRSKEKVISLNYQLGLAQYLVTKKLLDLGDGESLKIKINEINNENIEISVLINYSSSSYNCIEERTFIKSRWMDE